MNAYKYPNIEAERARMSAQTAELITKITTASAEQNDSIMQINSGIEQIQVTV